MGCTEPLKYETPKVRLAQKKKKNFCVHTRNFRVRMWNFLVSTRKFLIQFKDMSTEDEEELFIFLKTQRNDSVINRLKDDKVC